MSKADFEKLMLEAVDEGLSSLGHSSKQAIYFYLDKTFNLQRDQIPNHVEDFKNAIERIFGLGANFLETMIMKKLQEKVKHPIELDSSDKLALSEFVVAAKNRYLERNKQSKI